MRICDDVVQTPTRLPMPGVFSMMRASVESVVIKQSNWSRAMKMRDFNWGVQDSSVAIQLMTWDSGQSTHLIVFSKAQMSGTHMPLWHAAYRFESISGSLETLRHAAYRFESISGSLETLRHAAYRFESISGSYAPLRHAAYRFESIRGSYVLPRHAAYRFESIRGSIETLRHAAYRFESISGSYAPPRHAAYRFTSIGGISRGCSACAMSIYSTILNKLRSPQ